MRSTEPSGDPWDAPLERTPFAFLDLETTGTSPERDRICEIAVLRVDERHTDRWSSLVRVDSAGESARVHGLSDDVLRVAPPLDQLRSKIANMIEGAVLVGHRVAFDLAFLRAATERGEIDPPPDHAIDTHALAQRCLHTGAYGLRALCEELALPAPTHRAEPDAIACAALFDVLASRLRARTALQLWQAQQHERPPRVREDVLAIVREAHEQRRTARISYRVPGKPAFEDELEPWAMRGPRVQGWLRSRNALKMLRCDRILWAEPGESRFEPPIHFRCDLPEELL